MKTFSANANSIQQKWYVIDADGLVLGRLAVEIARRLRGKHKAIYTPNVDTGDYIVVVNVEKVVVTGRKATDKEYQTYTGYPGGLKTRTFNDMIKTHPERVLEIAVKGMLPKNTLGRAMFRKLKIYAGTAHPHAAQQPEVLEILG